MFDDPASFAVFFYTSFIRPLIRLSQDTFVLGYPLFNWLMGLTILALAVKFYRRLFSASDDDKG